jgi:large subunit ribosomal protein L23
MKTYQVLKYPLNTEKAVRMMEMENRITFIVDRKSKKADVKKALTEAFGVKVLKVNTTIGPDGKKKAYIKLDVSTPAMDIITKLGLM